MSVRKPFSLLKSAVLTLENHRIILFPFYIVAFLQFLFLEVLYFFPRKPLVTFFAPIIRTFFGEVHLHYPMNLLVIPQIFQYVQYAIFLLLSGFLTAVAVALLHTINEGGAPKLGSAFARALKGYVFIVIAMVLSFACMWGLNELYGMVFARALQIRSESGPFYMLKRGVIQGSPYFKFLISVVATTLFAYMIPAIIIDKKKIFGALVRNFACLFRNFFSTFFMVLIPSLFVVPILLLRQSIPFSNDFPEMGLLLLCVSILITILIDAVIYTAVTVNYLLGKDEE